MDQTQNINFPGYHVLELLGQTQASSVYRARRSDDHKSVIIKIIRMRETTPEIIARFRHEYETIRHIDMDGIVNPIDFFSHEGSPALVLEDFGGVSLKSMIDEGFTTGRFLEIAIRISEILAALHEKHITHRDIKPHNILLNTETDTLKITDFGISVIMNNDQGYQDSPSAIAGTLAYISPEQTGRMNCKVDYRTDMYSLGVTFYEMLTGKRPFNADETLEMIHAHMTRIPDAPHTENPAIPSPLSDIVMKLLAKSPEDRYQNCYGLAYDLRQCLRKYNETGLITPFVIGSQDMSPHFNPPSTLVGREEELAELLQAFERVCEGRVEVVFVAGEPGIGKSALVNKIRKPVNDKRGFFISGKFEQYQKIKPYSAIIQGFQSLTRQLLSESHDQLLFWKKKLLSILGQNGKIITDILPEMELIIGKQPDLPECTPEESQNRFNYIFKNFTRLFASKDHPLVVFLDDIQWADVASLHLISTIITDKSLEYVLCIGTYRNTETSEAKTAILGEHIPVSEITLPPLGLQALKRLLGSFIPYPPEKIEPLAKAFHEKTKGSPFFINQFLKAVYDKKLLRFETDEGWTWDLNKIRNVEATENVVTFMAGRLHELTDDALAILKLSSCIGTDFDLDILASISNRSLIDINLILTALIKEGMVAHAGNSYRFYHDRIQEAAYSLMAPDEREQTHYRVGMLILDQTPDEKLSSRIFTICDQLNQAGSHIKNPDQKLRLAELNLQAGIKSKETAAYDAAVNYLKAGCGFLTDQSWETDYSLSFNLNLSLMQCLYLNNEIDEAESLFSTLITHATTKVDKGRAYIILIILYISTKPAREALDFGLEALRVFGLDFDVNTGRLPVLSELIKAKYLIRKTGLDNITELPLMTDEELLVVHELYLNVGLPAYFVNPNLYALLSLKGFNSYFTHGLTPFSGVGCIVAANIIQSALGDYDLSYRLGNIAVKITGKLNDLRFAGMVNHIFGFFLSHWHEPVRNSVSLYQKSYELSINAGNLIYAALSISTRCGIKISLNYHLNETLTELKVHEEFFTQLSDPLLMEHYRMLQRLILLLKEDIDFDHDPTYQAFNIENQISRFKDSGNLFALCYFLFNQILICFWFDHHEKALPHCQELDKLIHIPKGALIEVEHFFLFTLVLLKCSKNQLGKMTKSQKALIHRNLKKLSRAARQNPENFKHKYDLARAVLKWFEGRFDHAVRLFHQAINDARAQGFLASEAMACELAAEFYFDHGYQVEGRGFVLQAYKAYTSWGATAKASILRKKYNDLIIDGNIRESTDSIKGTSSSDSILHNLDFNTVIKVSRVISREIKLDRLLAKAMHMSMTNSGAERGFLIFENQGRLLIQASEDAPKKEKNVLQAIPVDTYDGLCRSIVNFVFHSGKSIILGNALNDGPFTNDPYVVSNQCKSILCVPVHTKGELTCIFYMENNLASQVFTDERLEILSVIFAQMGISLQNARLYDEISSEIAERKHAEELLKTSETKYRTILEELQDIYCETDNQGNLTFINPAACAISEYPETELIGTSFRRLFSEDDQKSLKRYYRRITETGRPGKPHPSRLITRNQWIVPLEILASPIFDNEMKIVGYRNVARDVTERVRLENDLLESSKNVQAARSATILGLAKLAEYRDEETGTHLERIREYSRVLAIELSTQPKYSQYITDEYIEDIYNSSILHDIGKVGVPDAVLLKPGKLTPEEFDIIKTHPKLGGDALKAIETKIQGQTFLTLGKEIAYFHHEKWDGTGYPKGLKGSEIPLSACIVALADVYDALTSKRVYKDAFSHEKAKSIIFEGRGTHFSPDVVDAFIKNEDLFRRIRQGLSEEPFAL